MKIVNHSIIGSGLSSLIKFQLDPSSLVYSSNEKKISKKLRFYENLNIGGNTNIWGGYINHKIYKYFLKNPKFNTFSKNKDYINYTSYSVILNLINLFHIRIFK